MSSWKLAVFDWGDAEFGEGFQDAANGWNGARKAPRWATGEIREREGGSGSPYLGTWLKEDR